ncbi:MAG: heme-binding beta-barrel domain-containing protein, partial [Mailhella sp.]|nr:heme-binding beta-barrel domain-containing protein [Mailhella sp.]
DAQNNGPQVLYGLRYHVAVKKPGENAAFHEQVGYLLWEPATQQITMTLAIPRAQVAMAVGTAAPDADSFTVKAVQGEAFSGIISSEFLEKNFKTVEWSETFTFNEDGTLSYSEVTKLVIPHVDGVFEHKDSNTLRKVGFSKPNPRALDEGVILR